MDEVRVNGTNGMEHVYFLVANFVGFKRDHRFHRHQTEQLHQMILHHVTQGAGVVVIAASMFDAHGFDRR